MKDRSKCACWKLTYEGQKLIPENYLDPKVGYHYRRLHERVITGIYECNQKWELYLFNSVSSKLSKQASYMIKILLMQL